MLTKTPVAFIELLHTECTLLIGSKLLSKRAIKNSLPSQLQHKIQYSWSSGDRSGCWFVGVGCLLIMVLLVSPFAAVWFWFN